MSIFAIGDLHLSFTTDKPMDIYGPDWENHAERVKTEWENRICPDDTVIVAGDISWALKLTDALPDIEWIHNLPGKKVFIRGNHDLWWHGINKLNSIYDDIYFLQNTYYEAEGIAICGSRGWMDKNDPDFKEEDEKIYRRELIRLEMSLKSAKDAGFSDILGVIHYPPAVPWDKDTEFTKLFEKYEVKKVVYGHLHGEEGYKKGIVGTHNGVEYLLVSLDYLSCRPLCVEK